MATQTELDEARAALHQLMVGRAVVKVQREGRSIEYTQANIQSLRVYISDLESALGITTTRRGRPARMC